MDNKLLPINKFKKKNCLITYARGSEEDILEMLEHSEL